MRLSQLPLTTFKETPAEAEVISHQLMLRAGLIRRRKVGRVHRCRLDAAPLSAAVRWIETHRRFWEASFDALEDYLNEHKDEENQDDPAKPQTDGP